MPTPNGPRNQPRYDLQDDSDFPADLTQVSDWSAQFATERRGTLAERNALSGADLAPLLRFTNIDATNPSESQSIYSSAGWVPVTQGVSTPINLGPLYAPYPGTYPPTVRRVGNRVFLDGTVTNNQPVVWTAGTTYLLGLLTDPYKPTGFVPGLQLFSTTTAVTSVQTNGDILFTIVNGASLGTGVLTFSLHGISWPIA